MLQPYKAATLPVQWVPRWSRGKKWMHGEVTDAVQEGILKPINDLRLSEEKDTDDYRDGLVFGGDTPSIFCNTVNNSRVEKLQLRVSFSDYLVPPTQFGFRKVVRILSIVMSFHSSTILEERRQQG